MPPQDPPQGQSKPSLPSALAAKIPVPADFYQSPELPLILQHPFKIQLLSAMLYVCCAAAFGYSLYDGFMTTQDITTTIIVHDSTSSIKDGYTCVNLGVLTGPATPYRCFFEQQRLVDSLCDPDKPPVNCAGGKTGCEGDSPPFAIFRDLATLKEWYVEVEHMYFESFGDCMSKMDAILASTLEDYNISIGRDVYLQWPSYNGPISLGSANAKFTVRIRDNHGVVLLNGNGVPKVPPSQWDKCMLGPTNYLFDGQPYTPAMFVEHVFNVVEGLVYVPADDINRVVKPSIIPGSSVDIFTKSFSSKILNDFVGGSTCLPPAATICEAFRSLGPFRCSKTTQIRATLVQILGSAFSNASTLFTILAMGSAWLMAKYKARQEAAAQKKDVVATTNSKIVPKEADPKQQGTWIKSKTKTSNLPKP